MNQFSCTLDVATVLKYTSPGKDLLLLVSKQNLLLMHLTHKNRWKQIRNGKVMAPRSNGGKKLKKTNHWKLQRPVSEHPKGSLYIALLLLDFQVDL